jgi:DNA-binding MarR family transcriptional regulator
MQILTVLCRRISYPKKCIAKMQKKTPNRLAVAIIFYTKKAKEKNNSPSFNYDVKELASIVGTTQSYFKKLLKDLQIRTLSLKGGMNF